MGADGAPLVGVDVPIIPGIMPIQNYASFRRLVNLCKCPVPRGIIDDLDPIKVRPFLASAIIPRRLTSRQSDDAAVKRYGITLATSMIQKILDAGLPQVHGVHFCTLNLEKSVRTIMDNLGWTSTPRPLPAAAAAAEHPHHRDLVIEQNGTMAPATAELATSPSRQVKELSISPSDAAQMAQVGFKHRQLHQLGQAGVGPGGGEEAGPHQVQPGGGVVEDWDEYPNGRFTDVRSPAYGEIDGYGNGLKVTVRVFFLGGGGASYIGGTDLKRLTARTSTQGLGCARRRRIPLGALHVLPSIRALDTHHALLRPAHLSGIPDDLALPHPPQLAPTPDVDRRLATGRRWRTER